MDSKLAQDLKFPLVKLPNPIKLRLADGDSSSVITHRTVPLQLHIGNHVETVSFYVTSLCHGTILGYSWLEKHNPKINWILRMVEFDSSFCIENCCVGSSRIQGLGSPPNPKMGFPTVPTSDLENDPIQTYPQKESTTELSVLEESEPMENVGFKKPISHIINKETQVVISGNSIHADIYPFVEATSKSEEDVPTEILSEFADVFEKDQADVLPPHRNFDCAIDIKPLSEPSYGKIYQLTREEDTVMQDWIKENLKKGYIRNSSSPHGAPCFFVKQKDKLRLCMDYRGLNKNTIKDRNPIPLISEMLRTLSSGKVFTTLDLRGAYNLLRIKDGDEQKTSFITKYGQFEFLVMPFGLANAPAQFQRMMNSLFQDMISKFVLVYLDDIVIYSDNLTEIRYLGYTISSNGIRMDPSKIESVQNWPTPKKVHDLQVFLGFANFYRALIPDYSNITCHLTKLLKKDIPFIWGPDQEKAILDLKNAFSVGDFLAHPDDSRPFILETDASDFAISGILSQYDDKDSLRPVAFYSRQMNDAERNYEIYDKELLAVVDSFKHWRHFLQGGLHPIMVLCDHKNLEYFMTTKKLTRRQAR
ncbi:hypothetical protein BASA84_000059 [Batrachochytrium salamandrivorans]|nr:hypothetical protein BASA84_000059 [Batrachochytrium salamandrivorans]